MRASRLILILALMWLVGSAACTDLVYWLRGGDFTTIAEGEVHYIMSTTVPTASSSRTDLGIKTEKGTHELARWYTPQFRMPSVVSGKAYLWIKRIESTNDSVDYRFLLHDFNPETAESILIGESEWAALPKAAQEISATLKSHAIGEKHRLKLIIEYRALNGGGSIEFVVDEPDMLATTTWKSSAGHEFTAKRVDRTAALMLSMCSSIQCSRDKDCDDYDDTTADSCINAESCESRCENKKCETECSINYDCKDGSYLTVDRCADKGECDAYCSNEPCTIKCSKNAECNDYSETTQDSCINQDTCMSYCSHEECSGERCIQRFEEYCGDGICDYGEEGQCSSDCPTELSIKLLDVLQGEYFVRGETILLKTKLTLLSARAWDADVTAKGFFGEVHLFNDGAHNDGQPNDEIYANAVMVPKELEGGSHQIIFEARYGTRKAVLRKRYVVIPELEIELKTDQQTYNLGDEMLIRGWLSRKSAPVSADVNITIASSSGKSVFQKNVRADKSGAFALSYRSNPLQDPGRWVITTRSKDSSGNEGTAEKNMLLAMVKFAAGYDIKMGGLKKSYTRGETIELEAEVKDENALMVQGTTVKAIMPSREIVQLTEKTAGHYAASVRLGWGVPTGQNDCRVTALKMVEDSLYGGELSFPLEVKPAEISISLQQPKKAKYALGDEIPFEIKVEYPDGTPVEDSSTSAIMADRPLELRESEKGGLFTATYPIEEESPEAMLLTIASADKYGNSGSKTVEFAVEGVSINYYLRKYWFSIALGAILLFLTGAVVLTIHQLRRRAAMLKKRKEQLLSKIKMLQQRYFKEGSLNREFYYGLINKYTAELKAISNEIRGKKK